MKKILFSDNNFLYKEPLFFFILQAKRKGIWHRVIYWLLARGEFVQNFVPSFNLGEFKLQQNYSFQYPLNFQSSAEKEPQKIMTQHC